MSVKPTSQDVTWKCVGVFKGEDQQPDPDSYQWADPDAVGFMYTVGVSERCGVELWCSLRAANGPVIDPNWLASILNQIAWDLIVGDILPGGTFREVREYNQPDGPALTFYIPDEPIGDRNKLETFQTPPDALIMEVTWDSFLEDPVGRQ